MNQRNAMNATSKATRPRSSVSDIALGSRFSTTRWGVGSDPAVSALLQNRHLIAASWITSAQNGHGFMGDPRDRAGVGDRRMRRGHARRAQETFSTKKFLVRARGSLPREACRRIPKR